MQQDWTRRACLRAGLCIGLTAGQRVWAFDRASEGQRYRRWLADFQRDVRRLATEVTADTALTLEHVHRCCASTVVPHSRAASNVLEWVGSSRPTRRSGSYGEIAWAGPLQLVLRVLSLSVPAGNGGLYPEPAGSDLPDRALSVWYMHINGGEDLQRYFDHPKSFAPYHLPPDGQLERKAYPFLLFEDQPTGLRWGGIGQEWFGAIQSLYDMQFQ